MTSALVGFLVVGALLSVVGQGVKRLVFRDGPKAGAEGWRGAFYVTMWAHPIVVGALLGLAVGSLPAPWEGFSGGVAWYALAGAFSNACYAAVSSAIKRSRALDVS